ncbi:MAG: nucleotidyltransferase [Thermoanaerobaculia bacterium]|nr:nucleotidyltransferase [Thermoanaerobaculia bacterium]
MERLKIEIPRQRLAAFCKASHIRRLSLFGSVIRDDFGPESDVDVLVEFEPGHVPGLIRFTGLELALGELLGGRKVDLNTLRTLSPYFRDEVLAEAEVQYAAA